MSSPTRVAALAAALSILVSVSAVAQMVVQAQPYVTGLSFPVAFIPDPTSASRQFVVEQTGRIRVVIDGVLLPADFLDVQALVTPRTPIEAERGLLGMVLAPDYPTSGRFFIAYTRAGELDDPIRGDIVISRYTRSSDDPLIASPGSRFDLRWGSSSGPAYIEHSARPSHNGGCMEFGPDGYLYIGLGDGGGNGDADNNAQNPLELKGKILRIDVDVPDSDPQGYAIPPDNPFVDETPIAALPEIWAFGVRNPWRFTFDNPALGGTGALMIADVGQDRWEEINYEPAGEGGRNYGWKIREGSNPYFNTEIPGYVAPPPAFLPLTDSAFDYFHSIGQSQVEGFSVTGGYIYRGQDLGDAMRGRYFFADFSDARLWSAQVTPAGSSATFSDIVEHTADASPGHMSSFAVDQAGELYLVTYGGPNQGLVSRLVCGVTVTDVVRSFSNAGGTGTLRVTAAANCPWSVSAADPWITLVSNAQHTGSGTVVFRTAPYDGDTARETTLTVGGRTIVIEQRPSPPVFGDVDGQASADILWQHDDGRVSTWLMSGLTVLEGIPLGPGSVSDPAWRVAASGDFDRDGSHDVVWQHQTDGRVALWLMSGRTLLSGVSLGQVSETAWKIHCAADMNQDGWMDLVWRHRDDGRISVWVMRGADVTDGRLLSPEAVPDLTWQIAAAADMNADGHTDLLWQNLSSGLISVWYMDRTTLTEGVLLSPPQVDDTSWRIRGVGDFNGDAKPDLLWQNADAGLVSVWLMNGATLVDGVLLAAGTGANSGWQIVGPK